MKNLMRSTIETKLGAMVVIADQAKLYLLEFAHKKNLENGIKKLEQQTGSSITAADNDISRSIKSELHAYFNGRLRTFKTPIYLYGTPFQKQAWTTLMKIPYATTISYATQANWMDKPLAYRAVGRANGTNRLAIIIPCHRVVNSNGMLGGYGAGLRHKQWLINHESSCPRCP